jgi:hypothetical protein
VQNLLQLRFWRSGPESTTPESAPEPRLNAEDPRRDPAPFADYHKAADEREEAEARELEERWNHEGGSGPGRHGVNP